VRVSKFIWSVCNGCSRRCSGRALAPAGDAFVAPFFAEWLEPLGSQARAAGARPFCAPNRVVRIGHSASRVSGADRGDALRLDPVRNHWMWHGSTRRPPSDPSSAHLLSLPTPIVDGAFNTLRPINARASNRGRRAAPGQCQLLTSRRQSRGGNGPHPDCRASPQD
jgi:hypothetical protein